MHIPEITYKPNHRVTISIDDDRATCVVEAKVPDALHPGLKMVVRFVRSCEARFLEDPRFTKHWVTGVIMEFETHEARHWIKIDGVGLREPPVSTVKLLGD